MVLSTRIRWLKTAYNSSSRGPDPALLWALVHMRYTYNTHTGPQTYMEN